MISFENVSAVRIPEGNVVKIVNAAGEIPWQKTYTWEKWSVEQQYQAETTSDATSKKLSGATVFLLYQAFSCDPETGALTLSGEAVSAALSDMYESGLFRDARYTEYDGTYYYINNVLTASDEYRIYFRKISVYQADVKGTVSYGTVQSADPAAYPDNGVQDGYWYVKQ